MHNIDVRRHAVVSQYKTGILVNVFTIKHMLD